MVYFLRIELWDPFQMALFPWLINGGWYQPLTSTEMILQVFFLEQFFVYGHLLKLPPWFTSTWLAKKQAIFLVVGYQSKIVICWISFPNQKKWKRNGSPSSMTPWSRKSPLIGNVGRCGCFFWCVSFPTRKLSQWLHPRKLTWQWKSSHLKMYLLLKMIIFNCHVTFSWV